MEYTRTAIPANRSVFEPYREMEGSLRDITSCVARIRRILSASGRTAPQSYLSATRAIRVLQEAWSRHLEMERVVFPRMLCRNLITGEFLKRITESNQAIEKQLEAMLSAPWPRSPHAGLQSLRAGIHKILSQLVIQIEMEQRLILSAIRGVDRTMSVAACAVSETSQLVAS